MHVCTRSQTNVENLLLVENCDIPQQKLVKMAAKVLTNIQFWAFELTELNTYIYNIHTSALTVNVNMHITVYICERYLCWDRFERDIFSLTANKVNRLNLQCTHKHTLISFHFIPFVQASILNSFILPAHSLLYPLTKHLQTFNCIELYIFKNSLEQICARE